MNSLVDAYLALRRAAGFKLQATECRLRAYARFADEHGDKLIRVKTAMTWAASAATPCQRHVRLRDLAIFARYLRAENPEHELPDARVFPRDRRVRLPYIFSNQEIVSIMDASARLKTAGTSGADTYPTLFGLLATTGLRIGEACKLKVRDLTKDGLFIRNTKFRKSRLLPLHPTTMIVLTDYCAMWRLTAKPQDPLFVSIRGTALQRSNVWYTFDKIVRALGLRTDPNSSENSHSGPRVHDFRHTFAVRSLEECPASRAAITRHMLALSTYLGHVSVESTYWYLRATPQLMTEIADACEISSLGGAP